MDLLEKVSLHIETFTHHKKLTLAFLDAIEIVDRRAGFPFSDQIENIRKKVIVDIKKKKQQTNCVNIQGHMMYLDPLDSLDLFIFPIYEPAVTKFFKAKIKNDDVVLDLGAHIGYYTLIAARLVGQKGHVFAFEPSGENFRLLKKNAEMNGYKNVTLMQKAVSNRTGKTKLYLDKRNSGGSNILCPRNSSQSIEVNVIRLDDYFKNYDKKIDFIKMDIEGAEALAIQGMPFLLQRNENVKIITEFCPLAIKRSGIRPEDYLQSLVRYGFKLYNLGKAKEPVVIEKLAQALGENHINLFCRRK